MTEDAIGGLSPQYQTYARQKCFIAYSESAYWSVDLLSACEEILSQPEYNLEVDYARKHFAADMSLRQKALELIANARYGIYDLSYWRQDERSPWQMPRNVMIELGIAIALNRPILLLRHTSNRELPLPKGLQCISDRILEFSGTATLKKVFVKHLSQWINTAPETAWWNRYCTFGGRVCDYREAHPKAKQLGKKDLGCTIADGEDPCRLDFRSVIEDVLDRFGDVTYTYLDALLLKEGYISLLCSHCQMVRSSPFAIYRISPHTPEEAFILIGISLALEAQFEYKIPRILITKNLQDIPSLLADHEVCPDWNDRERKTYLKKFIPEVLTKTRQTSWKPRPLPFIEFSSNHSEEVEQQDGLESRKDSSDTSPGIHVSNLLPQVDSEALTTVFQEFGIVNRVDLSINQAGNEFGFALVEMMTAKQAQKAVEALNGSEWMGSILKVKTVKLEELANFRTDLELNRLVNESESKDYTDVLKRLQHRNPPGKIRIDELSRELELDNRDVLAICDQLNIRVKSHSSRISISEAERILTAIEKSNLSPTTRKSKSTVQQVAKKPQILELRTTRISTNPPSRPKPPQQNSAEISDQSRTLTTPPSRPKRPQQNSAEISDQSRSNSSLQNPSRSNSVLQPKPVRSPSYVVSNTTQSKSINTTSHIDSYSGRGENIYVGNLSFQVTEQELRTLFSEYGRVGYISLPTDLETGRKRGFAFVGMERESDANSAISALNGVEWMGRELRLGKAKPR